MALLVEGRVSGVNGERGAGGEEGEATLVGNAGPPITGNRVPCVAEGDRGASAVDPHTTNPLMKAHTPN